MFIFDAPFISFHFTSTQPKQSLFAEGVKHMGGKKIHGQSVPDFQYRHALYVINRFV